MTRRSGPAAGPVPARPERRAHPQHAVLSSPSPSRSPWLLVHIHFKPELFMNAHAHDISRAPRSPLIVPLQWVGGGLRALLTARLLPDDVANVQFVCGPDEGGVLAVEVLANAAAREPGSTLIQPRLQTAFARCFFRFWRRAVLEWPQATPLPETWEWSPRIDGLVCRTRSPDVRVSPRRFSRQPVRRPRRLVTPRGTSGPGRHESSA